MNYTPWSLQWNHLWMISKCRIGIFIHLQWIFLPYPVSGVQVPALPSYRQGTSERHEWPSAMSRGGASETVIRLSRCWFTNFPERKTSRLSIFGATKSRIISRKWRNSVIHTSWRKRNNPAFLQVASLMFSSATPLPCPLGLPSERPQFLIWHHIFHPTWITKKY